MGQWMDYRCRVSPVWLAIYIYIYIYIGNSSTTSESSEPGLTVDPIDWYDFCFLAVLASFHTHDSFSVLFHHSVPMRECFGKHWCMSSTFPIVTLNRTLWHTATCYLTAPHCIRATSAPNPTTNI